MPDGYEVMRDVSNERWLNAIAEATGHEPSPLARAGLEEEVLVDLSTGTSRSQHMAIGSVRGAAGWTSGDELGSVDLLDALREARGLDPVDRSDFEETPFGGPMKV